MDIKNQLQQLDALVSKGAIVDAVKQFFANESTTVDYGKTTTANKQEMVEKMENFFNAIAKVNGITHHSSILEGNLSASEFTFDFNMKDGSKIYWHEIIKRQWNSNGEVIHEEYFNAQ